MKSKQAHNHNAGERCFICEAGGDDSARRKFADKISEHVSSVGWSVIGVGAGPDANPFAYTVGLTESYGHPELVMVGLSLTAMHQMLNIAGIRVRAGERFEDGQRYGQIAGGYDVEAVKLATKFASEVLTVAAARYGGTVSALQLMWPDAAGLFSWEDGFNPALLGAQTLPV